MKIAIDIRSLQSGQVSGVENYTANLVEQLLKIDHESTYTLFYNNWSNLDFPHLHFLNTKFVNFRIPNKLFNLSVKFFRFPTFERFIGEQDIVFLPNLNHFRFRSTTKVILTVHDLSAFIRPEFFDTKRRLWHAMLGVKKIFKEAHDIIAVSDYTKKDLERVYGIPSKKIHVIYPGITKMRLNLTEEMLREVRNTYRLPGNYILYVSTLEPRKNLVGLISALERMKGEVHLVIIGKLGWKYEEIFARIQNSTKSRFIHYVGYVPEEVKPYIIKLAKAVVYPSFYEGFGFVPLEAMSLGVPVVAGQFTSLPEVLGQAAVLVNPYDPASLAYALDEVVMDLKLREILVERGKRKAVQFTWERAASDLHKIIKNENRF